MRFIFHTQICCQNGWQMIAYISENNFTDNAWV